MVLAIRVSLILQSLKKFGVPNSITENLVVAGSYFPPQDQFERLARRIGAAEETTP